MPSALVMILERLAEVEAPLSELSGSGGRTESTQIRSCKTQYEPLADIHLLERSDAVNGKDQSRSGRIARCLKLVPRL